ncbi:hypothetical protein NUM3379_27730 [Kineococcus sp. NUM-3379]
MKVQNPVRKAATALIPAAAVVATLLPATPAAAHYSQCPPGKICLWDDTGYNGRFQAFDGSTGNIGAHMNDRTTSIWNRTGTVVHFQEDADNISCIWTLPPGGSTWNLPPRQNDEITAIQLGGRCSYL